MNDQKSQEKKGHLLLAPRPEGGVETELGKSKLTPEEYCRLLSWWQEKGYKLLRGWRCGFISRLKSKRDRWHDLIVNGAVGATEDERKNIRRLLVNAGSDPLMYLNLSGIPPLAILQELEVWKAREESLTRLRQRLRSKVNWKGDLKLFEKVKQTLGVYRPLLGDEGDQIKKSLTKAASRIENVQRHNRLPPGTKRIGGPQRLEFRAVVNCLAWIVISNLIGIAGLKKHLKKEKEIKSLLQPYWGPITAILMAAFPQWFTRKEGEIVNPIRNVKNASGNYGKAQDAIYTRVGKNVWLYAPPGHLEKLKWWELARSTRR